MWNYPWRYTFVDYLMDFLFFGILSDKPKKGEPLFVKWAVLIQMLKMICSAGLLAAASCIFVSLAEAFVIWMIASFFLMIFGAIAFSAYTHW